MVKPKVADELRRYFETNPDARADVIVVLNVPQPDLSHIFSGKPATPAPAEDRQQALEAAERAVAEIFERTGSTELRKLRNAASVLATIDRTALEALAASTCVTEIVGNEKLR